MVYIPSVGSLPLLIASGLCSLELGLGDETRANSPRRDGGNVVHGEREGQEATALDRQRRGKD